MNRLILIGNGFDIAHDLNTRYSDFIDNYWENVISILKENLKSGYIYDDAFVNIKIKYGGDSLKGVSDYSQLKQLSDLRLSKSDCYLTIKFKNKFFNFINEQRKSKWFDIERIYYRQLIRSLNDPLARIEDLNREFKQIIDALELYLTKVVTDATIQKKEEIEQHIFADFQYRDFDSNGKKGLVDEGTNIRLKNGPLNIANDGISENRIFGAIEYDKLSTEVKSEFEVGNLAFPPTRIHFLNFNYTQLHIKAGYCESNSPALHSNNIVCEGTDIHGELNSFLNPIIFGFGDELDKDYKRIENATDDYLEYIKSIKYSQTDNYDSFVNFMEDDLFQVFIMGHSCGTSDRTLLNTIFEHPNCCSIKIYYHQDKKGKQDNFNTIVKSIYRNFTDKKMLRDRVVNKTYSSPLVPVE